MNCFWERFSNSASQEGGKSLIQLGSIPRNLREVLSSSSDSHESMRSLRSFEAARVFLKLTGVFSGYFCLPSDSSTAPDCSRLKMDGHFINEGSTNLFLFFGLAETYALNLPNVSPDKNTAS